MVTQDRKTFMEQREQRLGKIEKAKGTYLALVLYRIMGAKGTKVGEK